MQKELIFMNDFPYNKTVTHLPNPELDTNARDLREL
jgi:hypothetical protein